jgi:hypothetical protein
MTSLLHHTDIWDVSNSRRGQGLTPNNAKDTVDTGFKVALLFGLARRYFNCVVLLESYIVL